MTFASSAIAVIGVTGIDIVFTVSGLHRSVNASVRLSMRRESIKRRERVKKDNEEN